MIRASLFVAGALLLADAGDWELRVSGEVTTTCATSAATCDAARSAVRDGWIRSIPREAETSCAPHPWCRPASSECIKGYSC